MRSRIRIDELTMLKVGREPASRCGRYGATSLFESQFLKVRVVIIGRVHHLPDDPAGLSVAHGAVRFAGLGPGPAGAGVASRVRRPLIESPRADAVVPESRDGQAAGRVSGSDGSSIAPALATAAAVTMA